jgi:menaquinone-dependent protoporphyrinogen oxidase
LKTLIVYATKYGSVTSASEILEPLLKGKVRVARLGHDKVPDPDSFDNVIIGGSIYMGRIQKEVSRFCTENSQALLEKKLGLFVCAGEHNEDKRNQVMRKCFPVELVEHATILSWFGHEVHWEDMTWLDRLALRMATGTKESYSDLKGEEIERFAEAMNG